MRISRTRDRMIGEDVPTTPANDVTEADVIIEKKAGARMWEADSC